MSRCKKDIQSDQSSDDSDSHVSGELIETFPTEQTIEAVPAVPATSPSKTSHNPETEQTVPEVILGCGHRIKQLPLKLQDYVLNTVIPNFAASSPALYSILDYVDYSVFSVNHCQFLAFITISCEPTSFKKTMEDTNWRLAVRHEIDALEDSDPWEIVILPKGKKALACKWVFRLKFIEDGTLERHKARLVVCGNKQVEGNDYDETIVPVAKMTTVRSFLQLAASINWEVHQMDVHNALLHGNLKEEVYMRLPPGFRGTDKDQVCRLRKSLYGLKQAPRYWFAKLTSALLDYGFEQSRADYSLFTLDNGTTRLHVLVYGDDLIISWSTTSVINTFKSYLRQCFHMKDLRISKYFIGIELARSPTGIYMCQRKYVPDILKETGLLAAKPVDFSLEQNHKLAIDKSELLDDAAPYKRLVRKLIYLCNTR